MGEDEIAQITKSFGSVESLGDKEFKIALCLFDWCSWRPESAPDGGEWGNVLRKKKGWYVPVLFLFCLVRLM